MADQVNSNELDPNMGSPNNHRNSEYIEVDVLISNYERKIGVYESTLELFKENLSEVHSKYIDLKIENKITDESNQQILEELEYVTELYESAQNQMKSLNSKFVLECNKSAQQAKQIDSLNYTLKTFHDLFDYIKLDYLSVIKEMKKTPENKRYSVVVAAPIIGKEITNEVNESKHKELAKNEQYETKDVITECTKNVLIAKVQKKEFEIEMLPNMDKNFFASPGTLDVKETMLERNISVASSCLSLASYAAEKETNKSKSINSAIDEESSFDSRLETYFKTVESSQFNPFQMEIYANKQSIPKVQLEKGTFYFIPSSYYYRFRDYISSKEFKWSNDEYTLMRFPYKNKDQINLSDEELLKTQLELAPFNVVKYNNYNEIPADHPIDGTFVFFNCSSSVDDDLNQSSLTKQDTKLIKTHDELKETEGKSGWYHFVPNVQYSYLNGQLPLPKFMKIAISSNVVEGSQNNNTEKKFNTDSIWKFKVVSYSSVKEIPASQPINGFYIFSKTHINNIFDINKHSVVDKDTETGKQEFFMDALSGTENDSIKEKDNKLQRSESLSVLAEINEDAILKQSLTQNEALYESKLRSSRSSKRSAAKVISKVKYRALSKNKTIDLQTNMDPKPKTSLQHSATVNYKGKPQQNKSGRFSPQKQ